MKYNISYPATAGQKTIAIEGDAAFKPFVDKRISQEVAGDSLGEDFKGYIFRIAGGNDKQGFPMKQGVLTNNRVRLLLDKNKTCYRPRRKGERKRKSVRGCIVDNQISVISLVVVKRGEKDIPGVTDVSRPRRLGPKRASKIKNLFALEKGDNVVDYAKSFKRKIEPKEDGKKHKFKYPKVQRLVTPARLQKKRHMLACKKARATKQKDLKDAYHKMLAQRAKAQKEEKAARKERLSSTRKSGNED